MVDPHATDRENLVNRLRCRYPIGPLVNGKPEFGWRDVGGPIQTVIPTPIMVEAAERIERLEEALAILLPGLILDLRYADDDDDKDALQARVATVQEALNHE